MKTTDVDVFLADIHDFDCGDHDCEALAVRLDRDCAERLARITHPRRRAQFILGRCLLSQALRHRYGAIAEAWQLDAAVGKPRLVGAGAPEISLSHSRELVACAIAQVEIGLDVEYCRERDFATLAEQICSPAELRRFLSLPAAERNGPFYRIWTLREATFKLYGRERVLSERDGEVRHEYFLPRERFLGALVARSTRPLHLILHPPSGAAKNNLNIPGRLG